MRPGPVLRLTGRVPAARLSLDLRARRSRARAAVVCCGSTLPAHSSPVLEVAAIDPEFRPVHATPYARPMSRLLPIADRIVDGMRAAAVERLQLRPGSAVLDVGCGTGSSFPRLRSAVGPAGRVVGVEIDPGLAALSRRRIGQQNWRNVELIESAAESVRLEGRFDGLLMFAAHEVLTSQPALDNLFACLNPGACVVATGARASDSLPGRFIHPLLRLVSRRWLPFSPPIDAQPWRLLPTVSSSSRSSCVCSG